ncbi:hypothetical protein L6452_03365 [Arctium lappa]|uniref:Uncharacterized protein n=1 Tax=Arctium lappa TaxID=4217 RepID=A0ACB9FLN0_ARCLA|nr:hypothetical protein L6452_03365 [Arctium lappa]
MKESWPRRLAEEAGRGGPRRLAEKARNNKWLYLMPRRWWQSRGSDDDKVRHPYGNLGHTGDPREGTKIQQQRQWVGGATGRWKNWRLKAGDVGH